MADGCQGLAAADDSGSHTPGAGKVVRHPAAGPGLDGSGDGGGAGAGPPHYRKYQWRTLQLLPSAERSSYAGARVEVLERSDGRLQVRHDGEIVPAGPRRHGPVRCAPLTALWPPLPKSAAS